MIAIGADHGGYEMKEQIKEYLQQKGIEFKDFGTYSDASVDYPDYASYVCKSIQNKECDLGILICGTGVGIGIAANKHKGIRCAICSETFSAKMCKAHNNANAIAFGARVIGIETAKEIVDAFLGNEFEGDRHKRRVDKITKIEETEK